MGTFVIQNKICFTHTILFEEKHAELLSFFHINGYLKDTVTSQ